MSLWVWAEATKINRKSPAYLQSNLSCLIFDSSSGTDRNLLLHNTPDRTLIFREISPRHCIFHFQYAPACNSSGYHSGFWLKKKTLKKPFPSQLCQKIINLVFKSCIEPRAKYTQENLKAVFATVTSSFTNLLQDFLSEYLLQSGNFYHFSFNLPWQRKEILH